MGPNYLPDMYIQARGHKPKVVGITACRYVLTLALTLNQCFSTHRMAWVTNCFCLSAVGCEIGCMVFIMHVSITKHPQSILN